ncbi:phage tail tube protein [Aeromonas hydrophila]|uniref:phage tail tube protein n=1 Tax=Aeromonas TaxID=642 RepID=UPI0023793159|nr:MULTISPECIES: phage tail tube protein [Aeromonas]MDD9223477.1 phage tail tube protein [Aeromonas hydrophila]
MAGKVKNVWTTQGAGVWVNMDGQGKKDTEIVTAVADLTSMSPITGKRDVKKKGTVQGDEYSAPGKRTYDDPEFKFILNDKTTALYAAMRTAGDDVAKCEISVKVTYPWGETFVFDAIVLGVDTPEATEDHNIVEVSVKLSISGVVTRVVKAA